MSKMYIWKGEHSLECLELKKEGLFIEAKSLVTGYFDKRFFTAEYQVALSKKWKVKQVKFESSLNAKKIFITTDQEGNWYDEKGFLISDLKGCTDIDISVTPFTNALPINRLKLKLNEKRETEVVFINGIDGTIKKVKQHYKRLSSCLYHYQGSTGFETVITIDDTGMVSDYKGFFNRVEV